MESFATPGVDSPLGIDRRTVTRGAAWLTPAVVVAGSAPALAASSQTCPVLATPDAWAGPTYLSGPPEDGETIATTTHFRNNGENETSAYRAYFTTTLDVEAGVSYDLSTVWQYNFGNNEQGRSVIARFDLSIGGELLIRRYTRPVAGETTPPPPRTPTTATATYTATTTGSVEVRLLFVVAAATGQYIGGDDITVNGPVITNCYQGTSPT